MNKGAVTSKHWREAGDQGIGEGMSPQAFPPVEATGRAGPATSVYLGFGTAHPEVPAAKHFS